MKNSVSSQGSIEKGLHWLWMFFACCQQGFSSVWGVWLWIFSFPYMLPKKWKKTPQFSLSYRFIRFPGKAWIIDMKRFNLLQDITIDKPSAPLTLAFGFFFLKLHNDKASVRMKQRKPIFCRNKKSITLFKKKLCWCVLEKNLQTSRN